MGRYRGADPSAAEETAALAREALALVKLRILTRHRELAGAVERLEPAAGKFVAGQERRAVFGTDGRHLYYDAEKLLEHYRGDPQEVSLDYLHTLLHCLLGHTAVRRVREPALWDLACDLAVEGLLAESSARNEKERRSSRERAALQEYDRLTQAAGGTSAPVLYRYLLEHKEAACTVGEAAVISLCQQMPVISPEAGAGNESRLHGKSQQTPADGPTVGISNESVLSEQRQQTPVASPTISVGLDVCAPAAGLAELFYRDSHTCWYAPDAGYRGSDAAKRAKDPDGGKDPGRRLTRPAGKAAGEQEAPDEEAAGEEAGQTDGLADRADFDNLQMKFDGRPKESGAQEWERLLRRVQADAQIRRNRSTAAGNLRQKLSPDSVRMDYGEFLEKFGDWEETLAVSGEEFDLIFYEYGLRCYGNIPLIEPLEYRDDHRIRELVIAIDTSGSVQGEQIREFLNQTFAILRQPDYFSEQSRIHIVQCDAKLQKVTVIDGRSGLDGAAEEFEIRGLGGTDFVPVFEYIAAERAAQRMEKPNGLIYFTDGLGSFPESGPDYPVAFMLKKQAYRLPEIPAWAVKAVLDGAEIFVEKEKRQLWT